jgi:large subunit ribosomal protein L22
MVSKAIARFTRISPRKARMIADLVRGRQAGEALQLLEFTAKAAAPILKKLIESARWAARLGSKRA